jgi:hypothetical protein
MLMLSVSIDPRESGVEPGSLPDKTALWRNYQKLMGLCFPAQGRESGSVSVSMVDLA